MELAYYFWRNILRSEFPAIAQVLLASMVSAF
jgi:hypothetical protein